MVGISGNVSYTDDWAHGWKLVPTSHTHTVISTILQIGNPLNGSVALILFDHYPYIENSFAWKLAIHTYLYNWNTSFTKQLLPLLHTMHWDSFYFISYTYFLKIWLILTKVVSQPTHGSLWEIRNYIKSKDTRKRECAHRKKRNHGFRFFRCFACGLVVVGTGEKGPSGTLKWALIQKSIQRGGCSN